MTVTLPHTGLQVPHTDLTVKAIKTLNTDEGMAYNANLYLGTSKVGTVQNEGVGGPTTWCPTALAKFGLADMAAFVAACRDEADQPTTEEFVLASLVDEVLIGKEVRYFEDRDTTPVRIIAAIVNGNDEVVGTYVYEMFGAPNSHIHGRDQLAARHASRHAAGIEMWNGDSWERLISHPDVVNEGHGFYRITEPQHPHGDIVVQPRPGRRFCVFRQQQDEPDRYMYSTAEEACAQALTLAGKGPL